MIKMEDIISMYIFLTNQGGETVRLFFYHTVYNSEPEYGKKSANDYYTYK